MDTQPKSPLPDAQRCRNAQILEEILGRDPSLLRNHARRHAEHRDDADDALQSAYILFLQRFRGDCEPLAWLYTTVKREAWRIRRRSSRRRERSLDVPLEAGDRPLAETIESGRAAPEEQVCSRELLEERRTALAALKPDQRRALCLLGMGHSYAEICQLTGWTYTKVNRSIAEGRVALNGYSRRTQT